MLRASTSGLKMWAMAVEEQTLVSIWLAFRRKHQNRGAGKVFERTWYFHQY
jgi:hypothetical protein